MNIAIITAGGIGSRVGSKKPKQFIEVLEKPIIVYTLEIFQKHKDIDKIVIACLENFEDQMWEYVNHYDLTKVVEIVKGGKTGPESISNCLDRIKEKNIAQNDDLIIVHAGTRPLVSEGLISNGIKLCLEKGSAVPFINCPEVVVNKEDGSIIDRNIIARLQTPQIFKYFDIINMYKKAKILNFENISTTADLYINQGKKIELYEGSDINFKITYKEDIELFKRFIN